jgi:hypothetical protein
MEPKVEIERVFIGPAEARKLLDANPRNRNLNVHVARTYSRLMKEEKWPFVADPIRVDTDGFLMDGQKRMWAVENSGVTLEFVLVTGLAPETQAFMDIGQKRSPGDVFAINKAPNAMRAAAITGIVMRYEMVKLLDTKYGIEAGELLEYYQDPDNTQLIDRAAVVAARVVTDMSVPPAVIGGVHVVVSRISDPFAVNEFFEKLAKGFGLTEGMPVASLRGWLIRRHADRLKATRGEYFWAVARAWNEYAVGGQLFRINLPSGGIKTSEAIPVLLPAGELEEGPITEDNPLKVPYSKTLAENQRRARERARRRAG